MEEIFGGVETLDSLVCRPDVSFSLTDLVVLGVVLGLILICTTYYGENRLFTPVAQIAMTGGPFLPDRHVSILLSN